MMSQIHELYAAEEQASETWCSDPPIDLVDAQALAHAAVEWAKNTFGIRADLSVTVQEEVTEATASEILAAWEPDGRAADVSGPIWRDGAPESIVTIYTMVATDNGHRAGASEHLMLHELAHVVVGAWPEVVGGQWVQSPDHHGGLFARRHLDLVGRFHPDCLPHLADAYRDFGIETAEPDADPASWWNIPRPTRAELRALAAVGAPADSVRTDAGAES